MPNRVLSHALLPEAPPCGEDDTARRSQIAAKAAAEPLEKVNRRYFSQVSHLGRAQNEAKIGTILRLAKAFGITAGELLKPFRQSTMTLHPIYPADRSCA